MTQHIKNVLNSFAYDKVKTMMDNERYVTPSLLDQWEKELHGVMKENDQKIGKARIRELVVEYILNEFGTMAFGVKPTVSKRKEISDTIIRKMKNQRKKGFANIKATS